MTILPLPRGDLSLVSVSGKQLIAMDSSRVFYGFSLAGSVFRFLDNLCTGFVDRAMRITKKIDVNYHTLLAQYLIASGHSAQVLALSGLTNWEKLRHCRRHCLYAEAVPIVRSIVEQLQAQKGSDTVLLTTNRGNAVPVTPRALLHLIASMASDIRRFTSGEEYDDIVDDLLAAAYDAAPATATLIGAFHYVAAGYPEDIREYILSRVEQTIATLRNNDAAQNGNETLLKQVESSALMCHVLCDDETSGSSSPSPIGETMVRPVPRRSLVVMPAKI